MLVLNGSSLQICLIKIAWNGWDQQLQLGNVYHTTLWSLFRKSWTMRTLTSITYAVTLGAETLNFRFYTYKFGILESALYGLFLWILVSALHKLNEWHSLWNFADLLGVRRNFYTELPTLIFHFSIIFHMKYLYRISMCDAKKKEKKKVAPLLDMVLICTFTQRKICNSNHLRLTNIFLNVILAGRNFEILGTNDEWFGITNQV